MRTPCMAQQGVAAADDPGVDARHDKWEGPLVQLLDVAHPVVVPLVGSPPAVPMALLYHSTREFTGLEIWDSDVAESGTGHH